MADLNLAQKLAAWALPVLFAITLHEVAHGWVARHFGDPTAMMLGRLTLNPLKHIDPIGTVVVPIALGLLSGFIFGWARPVPITAQNLRHPKRDMAFVALAGPAANLLMALVWALVLRMAVLYDPAQAWIANPLIFMGIAGIYVNSILFVLNLIPLPPLDGGRVLTSLLPGRLAWRVGRVEPYGILILVGLLVTGLLAQIISPPITAFVLSCAALAGISLDTFFYLLTLLR